MYYSQEVSACGSQCSAAVTWAQRLDLCLRRPTIILGLNSFNS